MTSIEHLFFGRRALDLPSRENNISIRLNGVAMSVLSYELALQLRISIPNILPTYTPQRQNE
jgi:hypothetical protein